MIDSIEDAMTALQTAEQDVMADMGEDAVEAGWSDLVHTLAEQCTPQVRDELLRRHGMEARA